MGAIRTRDGQAGACKRRALLQLGRVGGLDAKARDAERGTSGSFLPSSQGKRGRRGGQPSPGLLWQPGKRRRSGQGSVPSGT